MWKKETGNIYVDILKNVKFVPQNLRLNRVKNNSLALSARMKGNEKFHQREYDEAMALYNESICFAEKGSEHLSLGYANRSNCFLKMQLYNQCFLDIELAMDSGYPDHLMKKLEHRKRQCREYLASSYGTPSEQAFSEEHVTLPLPEDCNSSWVSPFLQRGNQNAKGFTAKEHIPVGQTLLVEESYVHMMQSGDTNYCSSCCKRTMNYIPCSNCADTMYCSQKCANNNFHESECNMAIHFEDHLDGESSIFILRSVIIGINTFDDTQEMMNFVESCISPPSVMELSIEPSKLQYRTFLTLGTFSNTKQSYSSRKCYIIFDAIMRSKLAEKFRTKSRQRFLMHLIAYHILILRSNSFMGSNQQCDDDTNFIQKLDLQTSYFRHSCVPNIIHLDKGTLTIIKSILPIKRGDNVLITYVNCDDRKNRKERKAYLQELYGFRCKCKLCTSDVQHRLDAEKDPNFDFICENSLKLNKHFDVMLARDLKKRCIDFVTKYDSICKEVCFVSNCLGDILRLELINEK